MNTEETPEELKQTLIEDIARRRRRERDQETRDLLHEYHQYVEENFPRTGFCEASINNFLVHKYYEDEQGE